MGLISSPLDCDGGGGVRLYGLGGISGGSKERTGTTTTATTFTLHRLQLLILYETKVDFSSPTANIYIRGGGGARGDSRLFLLGLLCAW